MTAPVRENDHRRAPAGNQGKTVRTGAFRFVPAQGHRAWEEPRHEQFTLRTAWSLFDAFTEAGKSTSPRAQMEGSLRLASLFRRELPLS